MIVERWIIQSMVRSSFIIIFCFFLHIGSHKSLNTDGSLTPWAAENPFIIGHYRPQLSWSQCIRSIFRLHNETFNIWSHGLMGIGCLVCVCFIVIHLCSSRLFLEINHFTSTP